MKKVIIHIVGILIIVFISFLGGYCVSSKVPFLGLFPDNVNARKLADDYKSELGKLHRKYRIQAELFARANQYLKDSIDVRDREIRDDLKIIGSLEDEIGRLQAEARTTIDKTGDVTKTVHKIETTTDDLQNYFRFLKLEIRRIQEECREKNHSASN